MKTPQFFILEWLRCFAIPFFLNAQATPAPGSPVVDARRQGV
jgi:hypothetical protein